MNKEERKIIKLIVDMLYIIEVQGIETTGLTVEEIQNIAVQLLYEMGVLKNEL